MKIIAFYLPQFHTIPENDEWWGDGFTEWTNVKNARPLFEGHNQPKIPYNENYYNLLDDGVKRWQIDLAKENKIYGFCFYHYWFGGKLMLERPIEQYLENKELDHPFCLCWANPEWTKIWAGEGSKVLIGQNYGDEEQWEAHFRYLLPFFKDERYIKEDGKPLLIIYAPSEIECIKDMAAYIRKRCSEEGFDGIKLAYQYYVDEEQDKRIRPLFDYCIKFQPVYALHALEKSSRLSFGYNFIRGAAGLYQKLSGKSLSDHIKKVRKTDYDMAWKKILESDCRNKDLPCAFVNWDNTPRRGLSGRVFVGATPEKFENYLRKLIIKAKNEYKTEYIFLTAWNEWSEGSYLEPDIVNGDQYLKAVRNSLSEKQEY